MKKVAETKKRYKKSVKQKKKNPHWGLLFIAVLAVFIFFSDYKSFPFLNLGARNNESSTFSSSEMQSSLTPSSQISASMTQGSTIPTSTIPTSTIPTSTIPTSAMPTSAIPTPGYSSLVVTEIPAPIEMYVIASIANLRAEGNTDSVILEQLQFKSKVKRLSISGTWSKVITTDSVTGYIFSEFLSSKLPQVKPTSPPPRVLTKWPAVSTQSETLYNADLQKYYGKPYEKSSLPLKGITVILDPGHGGSDPGAMQLSNGSYVYEKTINLQVSLKIGDILSKYGADIIYTRKTDVYRGLYYRVALINKTVMEKHVSILQSLTGRNAEIAEANRLIGLMDSVILKNTDDTSKGGLGIFLGFGAHKDLRAIMDISREYKDIIVISVHCNRVLNSSTTKGAEIFYGTANAIYMDEKNFLPEEPKTNPLNPSYMYYDESARKSLATSIRDAIRDKTAILTNRGDYNSLYTRNYCMIREHNLASALVEIGYLSNSSDRSYIASSYGQTTIAGSIAYAVFNYFCR